MSLATIFALDPMFVSTDSVVANLLALWINAAASSAMLVEFIQSLVTRPVIQDFLASTIAVRPFVRHRLVQPSSAVEQSQIHAVDLL
jgi:hypothetical protein